MASSAAAATVERGAPVALAMALTEHSLGDTVDPYGYVDDQDFYETSLSQERSLALDHAVSVAHHAKLLQPASLRELCFASLRKSDSSALAQKLQPLLVRSVV